MINLTQAKPDTFSDTATHERLESADQIPLLFELYSKHMAKLCPSRSFDSAQFVAMMYRFLESPEFDIWIIRDSAGEISQYHVTQLDGLTLKAIITVYREDVYLPLAFADGQNIFKDIAANTGCTRVHVSAHSSLIDVIPHIEAIYDRLAQPKYTTNPDILEFECLV